MVTFIVDSKADLAKRDAIQSLVAAGELPIMTTITRRPSDTACWMGTYYGGTWYPPSDPRGAELEKMRYMLPASVAAETLQKSRCGICGADARLAYSMPREAMNRLWYGSCCRDAVKHWLEIRDLVDSIGIAEEPAKAAPVVLGSTEIEMGEGQYNRPGLSVRHSSQEKRLAVTFFAGGRTGKQKNFYQLRVKRAGNQVEIDTHGATKSTISLAEWQAFIDQVDVHICGISQNTVKLTPQLVKMARDVKAYRRKEPTDLEWKAESGAEVKPASEADLLKAWQKWMSAEVKANHDGFDSTYTGFILVGDMELVKETGPRDFRDLAFRHSGIQLDEHLGDLPKLRYSLALANRGSDLLPPKTRDASHGDVPDFDLDPHPDSVIVWQLNELSEMLCRDTDEMVRQCAARWNDILRSARSSTDAPQAPPEPASEAQADTPVALPQDLQSNSEAIEAIAMSKLPVSPEKIDELVEAVKVAISEWTTNADARILPDGYYLRYRPENAHVPTYIYLVHPSLPYRIVVGELSIMTGTDTHSELEFVSTRGEIREFMHKVAAGLKPADHPKLAGILVQQPIPEEAKAISRSTGGNEFADVAVVEELPLFAPENPESAA